MKMVRLNAIIYNITCLCILCNTIIKQKFCCRKISEERKCTQLSKFFFRERCFSSTTNFYGKFWHLIKD